MTDQHSILEDEIEKKEQRRSKKKRPTMKKSGGSVKELQRLIIKKSHLDTKEKV